jgi:hypothetical protein
MAVHYSLSRTCMGCLAPLTRLTTFYQHLKLHVPTTLQSYALLQRHMVLFAATLLSSTR